MKIRWQWISINSHFFFLFSLSVFIALKHSTLNVYKKKGSHRFLYLFLSLLFISLYSIQSGLSFSALLRWFFFKMSFCLCIYVFVYFVGVCRFWVAIRSIRIDLLLLLYMYIYIWTDMHKGLRDSFWSVLCFPFLMMPRFCRLLVFSFAARNGSCSFYFRYPLRFFIECTYYFLWQTDFIEKTRKSAHSVFEIKTICTNFRIFKQIRKENLYI